MVRANNEKKKGSRGDVIAMKDGATFDDMKYLTDPELSDELDGPLYVEIKGADRKAKEITVTVFI